jgi:hypothetical protein
MFTLSPSFRNYPIRSHSNSPFSNLLEEDEADTFFSSRTRNMDSLLADFLHGPFYPYRSFISRRPSSYGSQMTYYPSDRWHFPNEESFDDEEPVSRTKKVIRIPVQDASDVKPDMASTFEESAEEGEKERQHANYHEAKSSAKYIDDITPEEWAQIEKLEQQMKDEKRRMLERFRTYGVKERPIQGDGNCQFAALSDQIFGTPKYHPSIREAIVEWLRHNADYQLAPNTHLIDFLQTDFFPSWREYCDYLEQDGSWGDHITLLAASEVFRCKIVILSSVEITDAKSDPVTIITPKVVENSPIYLCHWHEKHYGSLVNE